MRGNPIASGSTSFRSQVPGSQLDDGSVLASAVSSPVRFQSDQRLSPSPAARMDGPRGRDCPSKSYVIVSANGVINVSAYPRLASYRSVQVPSASVVALLR